MLLRFHTSIAVLIGADLTYFRITLRRTRVPSKQTSALCATTDIKGDIFMSDNVDGMSFFFVDGSEFSTASCVDGATVFRG